MTLKLASKLFGGLEDLLNLLRLWVLTIKSTVHDDIHEFKQRVLASQFPPAVNMNTLFISFLIHFSSSKTSKKRDRDSEPCSNISLAMDKPKAGSFGFVFKNLAVETRSPRLSPRGEFKQISPQISRSRSYELIHCGQKMMKIYENAYRLTKTQHRITSYRQSCAEPSSLLLRNKYSASFLYSNLPRFTEYHSNSLQASLMVGSVDCINLGHVLYHIYIYYLIDTLPFPCIQTYSSEQIQVQSHCMHYGAR